MIELILGLIGIYLAVMVFTYVVLPIGSIVAFIGMSIGAVIGIVVAIKSYVIAIRDNINPYDYYEDKSPRKQEYAARRSYFFGPGYVQLFRIIKAAWTESWRSTRKFSSIRDKIRYALDVQVIKQLLWIAAWAFYLCAMLAVGVLGSFLTLCLGLAHAAVLVVVMIVIYILFSVTWVIDRVYLHTKSIKTSCPVDQERVVIPHFNCPGCGNAHTRLVPGPYGIWHRKCTCGEVLPTTFLLGRSGLEALCPSCGSLLAASDVQQFALTLVGGVSSGKTVLLSAFYHELFDIFRQSRTTYCEIPEMHKEMFEDLERWYYGEICPATYVKDTADMYSILIKSELLAVPRQFSLYDLAGEAFNDPSMARMLPQKQMKDSDGVIIVIDPLSSLRMREAAAMEGDDTQNFSDAEASMIISNFVTYLKSVLTNTKIKNKSAKPVSVVITKTDLSSISRRVSYHRIKMIMNSNPGMFESFDMARDSVCREFLMDIGLMEAVQAIEASFSEVHYFPVSAMGHAENGEAYEPEHVLEPFSWIIEKAQPDLAVALGMQSEQEQTKEELA